MVVELLRRAEEATRGEEELITWKRPATSAKTMMGSSSTSMEFLAAAAPPRFLRRRPPSLPDQPPPPAASLHAGGSRSLRLCSATANIPFPLWPSIAEEGSGGDGRSSTARLQR
jgi:hypothetical protein